MRSIAEGTPSDRGKTGPRTSLSLSLGGLVLIPLLAGLFASLGSAGVSDLPDGSEKALTRSSDHPVAPIRSEQARNALSDDWRRQRGAIFRHWTEPPMKVDLVLYAEPIESTPILARYREVLDRDELRTEFVTGEPGLEGQLGRVGHEEYGFAVQSLAEGWVEVTYAADSIGTLRRGWTRLDGSGMRFVLFTDLLEYCGAWHDSPASAEYFVQPGGRKAELPADHPLFHDHGPEVDHLSGRLDVLETRELPPSVEGEGPNEWLRVRASTKAPEEVWAPLRDADRRIQFHYEAGHCSAFLAVRDSRQRDR
jgi:hypothetical protein